MTTTTSSSASTRAPTASDCGPGSDLAARRCAGHPGPREAGCVEEGQIAEAHEVLAREARRTATRRSGRPASPTRQGRLRPEEIRPAATETTSGATWATRPGATGSTTASCRTTRDPGDPDNPGDESPGWTDDLGGRVRQPLRRLRRRPGIRRLRGRFRAMTSSGTASTISATRSARTSVETSPRVRDRG